MKLFFDTKKKTMPQQVKKNEEDIETLKNKGFIVKPRGEYDEDATYHKFDLVSYDGDSYIFVSDTDAVGVPVTNGDYWKLYTSGGLNIEIGTTETLPAGSNAVVTNTGTSTDAVLNFGIPKGEQGEQGPAGQDGADGRDGTDGVGVPSGGTTGQVLKKKSNTDYDTEWGSDESVPSGGTTGQVLKKKSNTDYDTEWANDSAGMENPMTSEGDLIYGGPTGTPTALAKGIAGQVLTMKQNGLAPEWQTPSGGLTIVRASDVDSEYAPSGDVLTADGNGGAYWGAGGGGSTPLYQHNILITFDDGTRVVSVSTTILSHLSNQVYDFSSLSALAYGVNAISAFGSCGARNGDWFIVRAIDIMHSSNSEIYFDGIQAFGGNYTTWSQQNVNFSDEIIQL